MNKSEMELSGDWAIVSSSSACGDEKSNLNGAENGSPKKTECENPIDGSRVQDMADLEYAGNESSSSDIDIIDETLEEIDVAPKTCFIPSTLTISSSVEKIAESSPEKSSPSPSSSGSVALSSLQPELSETAKTDETHSSTSENDSPFWSQRIFGHSVRDWTTFIWDFLTNLTLFQCSCIFGLTFCLYFCITINQTNIIALQEKGNVVAQMEKLVDELRSDNKHLQEQMLSEMKNDKLVSSFEHQIRELKKENSKLNHMLHDVVKVLEKQKDTQEKLLEKKESENVVPFKKEINKLKEHINLLKFDNEELQKQLVRMRYSSYSQGNKHNNDKDKEHVKQRYEKTSGNTKSSSDEINIENEKEEETKVVIEGLDINQLKIWNTLLDEVAKELGILEKEDIKLDDAKKEKEGKKDWNWKEDLKSKLKNANGYVSNIASAYGKVINKVYKSASDYIADAQENVQSMIENFQNEKIEREKDSKMWNIINNIGEKWGEVKKKVLSAYNIDKICHPKKESETANGDQFMKTDESKLNQQSESEDDVEDKWFFKRAQFREKLRENGIDDEKSVNWFLQRKRNDFETSGDDLSAEENEKKI